ncbi:MAG: MFS transporter, partial [Candidatus Komeilibacteria bacterium]|nr:MFS transporter [Candidatus Komeilibacteria bacterium]
LGGKIAERIGYEPGIFFGTIAWIFLYAAMYLIEAHHIFFYITPLIYGIQKSLYWPAYHANFAKYSDDKEEGREISTISIMNSLMFVIGPAVGGWVLSIWGFQVLFVIVAVLFLVSNIPMLITKEKVKPADVNYDYSLRRLFDKKNRRAFWAYVGFGEELIVLVIWPIFISLFLSSYLSIGWLIALSTLITAVMTLTIGRMTDEEDKRKVLRLGAWLYAASWLFRLVTKLPITIFFVDVFSSISKNVVSIPLTAITYENAKNHTVMNSVIFFEMSLAVGKLLACVAVYLLLFIFAGGLLPFYIIFILAAGITLLYTRL